ncbi:MAG: sugar transferase, partial [Bryobacteraceae bacterium]
GWIQRRRAGAAAARRYVYIGGTGETALRLGRLVEQSREFGLELAGFLSEEPGQVSLSRPYPVHSWRELPRLLETRVVDELLFAVDSRQLAQLEDLLLLCEEEGVRTRLHVGFLPHVRGRVDLEHLGTEPLLTFSGAPHDDFRLVIKRGLDVILSAAALLVLWPLMLAIALLIRLTSPGPAIFRQTRCGLNGRRFTLYKFRTMVADAEKRKAEVAHLNVKKTAFKIPNDPRLTPLGRWLRKFSLDELPQLWNVLKGEMSIVGPRPPVPEEVERYERWQRRRLRMRPGLTCLWTLAGRDEVDFDEWMRLDLEYIDRWSLTLDLEIILRTIPHVLLGRGAH